VKNQLSDLFRAYAEAQIRYLERERELEQRRKSESELPNPADRPDRTRNQRDE
jgi:hypothetical protein